MISPPDARAPRSAHRARRWLAALALVPAIGVVGAGAAQGAPAAGNAKPYSLSASAVLAKDGTTQLKLKVTSNDATYAVPSAIKQLQLKSFAATGDLLFTKNVSDVPTPGGATTLTRTDLKAGQPIKLQALAQTGSTKNTQVLETTTVVLKQPDLTVTNASGPAQVAPNAPVSIMADIAELNGDLGASGTVTLSEGATVLDHMAVSVAAGQHTGVGLATALSTPGTHTLTVSIGGVTPTEWDTTNNSATVTVEVIQSGQTLHYSANYWNNRDYTSNFDSDGSGYYCGYYYGYCGPRSYRYQEQSEYLNVSYWTEQAVSPTGGFDVKVTTEAGIVQDLHIDMQAQPYYYGGDLWYGYDAASGTSVQVYPYYGTSYVYVWHNAGHWVYSDNYCDYYYGCYTYGYDNTYGTYWGAQQHLGVTIDVPTTAGHVGGSLDMVLSPYAYDWDYWYWDWYYGNTHYWGHQNYFYGYGYGDTTL